MGKLKIEKGTQIGLLYRQFYTDKQRRKKLRYRGYIFLGVFSAKGYGLEITVHKVDPDRLPSWASGELYYIRSGRKNIGYMVKQERKSRKGKSYHFLKGKIEIGGLKIKIHAYPEGHSESPDKPAYRIEIIEDLECGVVRLV